MPSEESDYVHLGNPNGTAPRKTDVDVEGTVTVHKHIYVVLALQVLPYIESK